MSDALDAIDRAVTSVADPSDLGQTAAACRAVSPALVDDVVYGAASGTDGAADRGVLVGVGIAASPGTGVGRVALDAAGALTEWNRGHDVVLVCDETTPADEPALRVAAAVVTRRGGVASHAAILARQWGVPAVCGIGAVDVPAGTTLVVDGSNGEVRRTDAVAPAEEHDPLAELPASLETLLGWADALASPTIAVHANADLVADAQTAFDLGAAGIGLCRTEHQFLGERARLVERLIGGDASATAELVDIQRTELRELFEVAAGRPVVVRLLDAPQHEFVPGSVERNPTMGVRGVRLAVLHPAVAAAQVEAIAHAVADVRTEGVVDCSVMLPMVSSASEVAAVRPVVDDALFRVGVERGTDVSLPVGVMIETPRAALEAAALARRADFFSFGTNDLTQLVYGLGRDEASHALTAAYVEQGLWERSPFQTLDGSGVVRLMALAAEMGRGADDGLGLSLCGEHGGDAASIAIAVQLRIDMVSVSPYRVPAARLAAAHAVIGAGGGSG